MTGVSPPRIALIAALAMFCFSCSGKMDAERASGATDSTERELGAKLTIPVGAYAGCTTSLVGVRPQIEAVSGGEGTVTLSVAGDGTLNAAHSFGQWLSGTVAFAPTSGATAGLGTGPFEIAMFDGTANVDPTAPAASADPSNVSVSVAAGTLVLSDHTLFISLYAHDDDTQFSVYSTCPVPTSLPSATIVNSARLMGNIPSGSYAACTTSSGSEMPGGPRVGGGDLTLIIAKSNGSLTTAQSEGFPSVCNLAFDGLSGTTAPLRDGQTCLISEPCPRPLLGTWSAPSEATLTNMTGAIDVAGGALFINVVGDAPAGACGSHVLSWICPPAP